MLILFLILLLILSRSFGEKSKAQQLFEDIYTTPFKPVSQKEKRALIQNQIARLQQTKSSLWDYFIWRFPSDSFPSISDLEKTLSLYEDANQEEFISFTTAEFNWVGSHIPLSKEKLLHFASLSDHAFPEADCSGRFTLDSRSGKICVTISFEGLEQVDHKRLTRYLSSVSHDLFDGEPVTDEALRPQ